MYSYGIVSLKAEDLVGMFMGHKSADVHLRLALLSSSLPHRNHQSFRLVIFWLRPELPRCGRNVCDAQCFLSYETVRE